jgi:hypothetical protein
MRDTAQTGQICRIQENAEGAVSVTAPFTIIGASAGAPERAGPGSQQGPGATLRGSPAGTSA